MNGRDSGTFSRRNFLKLAGLSTASPLLASESASAKTSAPGEDVLDLSEFTLKVDSLQAAGVYADEMRTENQSTVRVVGDPTNGAPYATIQAAYDALPEEGGKILVTTNYTSEEENYPIRFEKEVHLSGMGFRTELRPPADKNGINVVLEGNQSGYCVLENFTVRGGRDAIHLESAVRTTVRNVSSYNPSRHSFYVDQGLKPNGVTKYSMANIFTNCRSRNAGSNGWWVHRANDFTLLACNAVDAGYAGAEIRGTYSARVIGGFYEDNGEFGILGVGSDSVGIRSSYIEGNGSIGVPLIRCDGVLIDDCYLNGMNRAGKGITVNRCSNVEVHACRYNRYQSGLISILNDESTNTDIHAASHFTADDTPLLVLDRGTKTRSDSVLLPQDLSSVRGDFEGDKGIHLGSDGTPKYGVWDGSSWHLMTPDEELSVS